MKNGRFEYIDRALWSLDGAFVPTGVLRHPSPLGRLNDAARRPILVHVVNAMKLRFSRYLGPQQPTWGGISVALLYRAIWEDDRTDTCGDAWHSFMDWSLASKIGDDVEIPESGSVTGRVRRAGSDVDFVLSTSFASQPEASRVTEVRRASLIESFPDGSRWDTTLRTWQDREGHGWIWTDVEAVGPQLYDGMVIGCPRFVRDLLDDGSNPRIGDTQIAVNPRWFRGAEQGELLAESVSSMDRQIPIVVFAYEEDRIEPFIGPFTFESVVERTGQRLAGIASVAVADRAASAAMTDALTETHGIWGGAYRTYLPGVDPATRNDGWRHRFVTPARYLGSKDIAATKCARIIGPISAMRRPPDSYSDAKQLLNSKLRSENTDLELLGIADLEVQEFRAKYLEAKDSVARLKEELIGLTIDLEDALEERATAIETIDVMTARLNFYESADRPNNAWGPGPQASKVPARAVNPTEAARNAQIYLNDRLVVPPEALRDLSDLDATDTSAAWGQTSWDAFRALHAYATALAADTPTGGFWAWCQNSRHPHAWRATDKKLSMKESKSVYQNPKFREKRMLPVPVEFDKTGKIYMESHMKIATGGGDLAPRIYFLEDPERGKVYVGFFGPHKHMPNTKS